MTNSNTGGARRTALNKGVKVCREIHRDGREVVCTLKMQSQHDKPALVRIKDEFPTELPVEEFGFKSGGEPKRATITSDGVLIEETVADDPVEVVYGVELSSPVDDMEPEPPTVQGVDTQSVAQDTSEVDDSDTTSEPSTQDGAPDRNRVEAGASETTASTDGGGTVGGRDPDPAGAVDAPGDAATDADAEPTTDATRSPIVADAGGSTDEHDGSSPRNIGVRLDWLSARVEEFASYATALEEIIDEHGTASEIVERFERDVAALESDLDAALDDIAAVEDSLDAEIAGVRAELDDIEEAVDLVGDTTTRLDTEVDEQASDIAAVSDDVESLNDRVDEMESELGDVRDTVQSVERDLTTVQTEVEQTREELATLQDEFEEMHRFRDRLASVFDADADLTAAEAVDQTPADDENEP